MSTTQRKKKLTFDEYRYQINPITTNQLSLFPDEMSLPELIRKKNDYFFNAIESLRTYESTKIHKQLPARIFKLDNSKFYLKLGNPIDINIINSELEEAEETNYPYVYILIDNDPSKQTIAINRNQVAFPSTKVVAGILEHNINMILNNRNLEIHINPILDKHEFWELVSRYENRITAINFELVRPNMPSISHSLGEEIKGIIASTNSGTASVSLKAPDNRVLENINKNNKYVKSLADYVTEGAGNVKLHVKGVKKVIYTNGTIRSTTVDEMTIKGNNKTIEMFLDRFNT